MISSNRNGLVGLAMTGSVPPERLVTTHTGSYISGQSAVPSEGAADCSTKSSPIYKEIDVSVPDRVEEWFFKPLEALSGHEAFVAMALSLLIYERYLRDVTGWTNSNFPDECPIWKEIANDFGLSEADARKFWRDWRHGLLHSGMPSTANFKEGYQMSHDFSVALAVEGNAIKVHPYHFRDKILKLARNRPQMWNGIQNSLAAIVEVSTDL